MYICSRSVILEKESWLFKVQFRQLNRAPSIGLFVM